MTDIICNMEDCVYRSKKPMKKFIKKNGEKCYKCTLRFIQIRDESELELYDLIGKELPCCDRYEKH